MSDAPIYEIKALRDVVLRCEFPYHPVPKGESKVEITGSRMLELKEGEIAFVFSVLGIYVDGDEIGTQSWPPEKMPSKLLDAVLVKSQAFSGCVS